MRQKPTSDDVTSCAACRCLFVGVMTAGRVIGDRYEVGALLGRGGAASVWLARDCWADRSVAVLLAQRAIESAPDYDPSKLITPSYEVQLFKHYGTQAA